jgi:hypothetical protein
MEPIVIFFVVLLGLVALLYSVKRSKADQPAPSSGLGSDDADAALNLPILGDDSNCSGHHRSHHHSPHHPDSSSHFGDGASHHSGFDGGHSGGFDGGGHH